jgi:clan AA aspartic protease
LITGHISADLEAQVYLRIRGSQGLEAEVVAIIDTGFSDFLTLPSALVSELELLRLDTLPIRLADGTLRRVEVYEARVYWNGAYRLVPVQVGETTPLVGMALLHENLVSLEVVPDGIVSIEEIA